MLEQVNLLWENVFLQLVVCKYVQYSPKTDTEYMSNICIGCWSRKKGMDESGNVNSVRILPPSRPQELGHNLYHVSQSETGKQKAITTNQKLKS